VLWTCITSLIDFCFFVDLVLSSAAMGYLGAVAGGLFTSFALQGLPRVSWGRRLLDSMPLVESHLRHRGVAVEENVQSMAKFVKLWTAYLEKRGILDGTGPATFPAAYGVAERDTFYTECSVNGWGGATGIDAPMIAYDAFLSAGDSWSECCLRGVLHGGDNDSTGVLIGAWYGATYGFAGVPVGHYQQLEYHDRMVGLAQALYERYGSGTGTRAHEGAVERIASNESNEDAVEAKSAMETGSDEADEEEEETDPMVNQGMEQPAAAAAVQ
jgi:hypothetical protein